ncbi:MAG: hypothetical protein HZC24_14575, partial [Rhodocyclales bacterium]|nr:hypothetical protein [Rhodocyclales bacterium]
SADNAFVLDPERLPLLRAAAEAVDLGTRAAQVLDEAEAAAKSAQADETIAGLTTDAMPQMSGGLAALAGAVPAMNSLSMESAMPQQGR